MYKPIYKEKELILGQGHIIIATGWTNTKKVADSLDPADYAAIGYCRNAHKSLDYLIRNLLANPVISTVIALNDSPLTHNSQGGNPAIALSNFWDLGVKPNMTSNRWDIEGGVGTIAGDIPWDALEELRDYVFFSRLDSLEHLNQEIETFKRGRSMGCYERKTIYCYEPPVEESIVQPGRKVGHVVHGATVAETWVKILHRVMSRGKIEPCGYGNRQEIIDLLAVVENEGDTPDEFYFPDWIPVTRESLNDYLPCVLEDKANDEGNYTYGLRLRSWFGRDQVEDVIVKLLYELESCSAVMSIWDTNDHDKGGSPCLNHIWVRVIDNKITLTAVFRSNDMFDAWCANVMALRSLQNHIREAINYRSARNLEMGETITLSESCHVYDHCFEFAQAQVARYFKAPVNYSDPVGNFLVKRDGRGVAIERTDPRGEVTMTYSHTNPLTLVKAIAQSCPDIDPYHIGYLGMEIQRAFLHPDYTQDRMTFS